MVFRIQAKKFSLCTKCGRAYGHTKNKYCKPCKSETIYLFDSQSESMRYLYLKNSKSVTYLEIQPEFKLYAPEINHSESWAEKNPRPNIGKTTKWIVAAKYTADFKYFDCNNPKGWVIEDFKPYNRVNKKPIIDASTQLRLNWLHSQCSKAYDIFVSFQVPKVGYDTKLIKPNQKK